MRLAVARLWFEGNSFTPVITGRDAFARREWRAGPEALAATRDSATEMGGLARFLDANPHWQATVLRAASAPPGGPMDGTLFDEFLADLSAGLAGGSWDAVYLSLHGSAVVEDRAEPELDILRLVRSLVGTVPVGASFDLHANLSLELAELLDCASGYRTHPHIDMAETAEYVLIMLDLAARGVIQPVVAAAKAPALLHSHNMRTDAGPMAEIMQIAAGLVGPPLLDVSPFGGFVWADTPGAGASVLVTVDGNRTAAQCVADLMVDQIMARADRFRVSLPGPEQAIRAALAGPGPAVVLDCGDNPLSGGIADSPELLRALLAVGEPTLFAFLWDPGLVDRAVEAGIGGKFQASLGGRLTVDFGPPIDVDVQVERLTDGRFTNRGPMEWGLAVDLGPTAVLATGSCRVVVTSTCQAAIDPGWFDLHGLDPTAFRLAAVKGKNHFRAAYGAAFATIVETDCPGPAALDLSRFPFRHVPAGLISRA